MTTNEIRKELPGLQSREDLLNLLNRIKMDELGEKAHPFTLAQFNHFSHPARNCKHYRTFSIPKKRGGSRRISAPQGMLRSLLSCYNILLQAAFDPDDCVMGFVKGKSVVDNASTHIKQTFVFNADLSDFFTSINHAMVIEALTELDVFTSRDIITCITGACCSLMPFCFVNGKKKVWHEDCGYNINHTEYVLPQGSPASPVLSNIVCRHLDKDLKDFSNGYLCNYTRYADDITFSSNYDIYDSDFQITEEFTRIVERHGFTLNRKKTRIQKVGRRQEVTGLIVGDKVNVPRTYIKDITNVLHIWERYGYNHASAKFALYHKSNPVKPRMLPDMISVLRGKLNYLKMVRGEDDGVYKRLSSKFKNLCKKGYGIEAETFVFDGIVKVTCFESRFNVVLTPVKTTSYHKNGYECQFSSNGQTYRAFFGKKSLRVILEEYGDPSANWEEIKKKLYISMCSSAYATYKGFWLLTVGRPHVPNIDEDFEVIEYYDYKQPEKYYPEF